MRPITFRLNPDSDEGKRWLEYIQHGYEPRQIVELLLRKDTGLPIAPQDNLSEQTIKILHQTIERLEYMLVRFQQGGVNITPEQLDTLQVATTSLTDEFLNNMSEGFEPGFTGEE